MYQTINKDLMLKKMKEGAILIDVRTKEEYNVNHIAGAINIPLSEIVSILNIIKDKDKVIILYCSTGKRSYKAYKSLNSLGYNNIYDFKSINNF